MIAIVSISSANSISTPTGWIIAVDIDDARRQAHAAGRMDLAEVLYRLSPFATSASKSMILPDTWLLRT
jgi:hypothetical protein